MGSFVSLLWGRYKCALSRDKGGLSLENARLCFCAKNGPLMRTTSSDRGTLVILLVNFGQRPEWQGESSGDIGPQHFHKSSLVIYWGGGGECLTAT